jgi:hypothetical protein
LAQELVDNDPLAQVYFYRSPNSQSDSTSVKGVVVLPSTYQDQQETELKAYNLDGTESTLSNKVEPDDNYLVISTNERMDGPEDKILPSDDIFLENPEEPKSTIKRKKIQFTNARFSSMEAKRSVESWAAGEPEVRLDFVYVSFNSLNNTVSPNSGTFRYPENWVETKWWGESFSKWVDCSIELPMWYKDTQTDERKIIFTEEDQNRVGEAESNYNWTHKDSGTSGSLKVKLPNGDKDKLIASTYIYFNSIESREYHWGLLQVQVKVTNYSY